MGQVSVFDRTFIFERLPLNINHNNTSNKRSGWKSSLSLSRLIHRDAQIDWADQQFPLRRTKRPTLPVSASVNDDEQYPSFIIDDLTIADYSKHNYLFSDELWPAQWYLQDNNQLNLNVLAVYKRGWTGRGVRVAVLDDGLEHWHDDLAQNYVRLNFSSFHFVCVFVFISLVD